MQMPFREDHSARQLVDQFLLERVDSVPHLEALLLMWRQWPRRWRLTDMQKALYLDSGKTLTILEDLVRRGLITGNGEWQYVSEPGHDQLLEKLEEAYRTELIRISRLIHTKSARRTSPGRSYLR